MRALKILKELRKAKTMNPFYKLFHQEKRMDLAIKELETISNKTCEGCKFGKYGVDSLGIEVECELNWDCNRGRVDKYERKVI